MKERIGFLTIFLTILLFAQSTSLEIGLKSESIDSIFYRVNQERSDAGLPPLAIYGPLNHLAQLRCEDMAKLGKVPYNHIMPKYGTFAESLTNFGIDWTLSGENIGYSATIGQAGQNLSANNASIVASWMQSIHHRDVILSNSFGWTGIGMVVEKDRVWYVQMFIARPAQSYW